MNGVRVLMSRVSIFNCGRLSDDRNMISRDPYVIHASADFD